MRNRTAFVAFLLCVISFAGTASGQLTITDPNALEPAESNIRQVSMTAADRFAATRFDRSPRQQLQVTIQYLSVDDETRKAIYAGLEPESIKTTVSIPDTNAPRDLAEYTSLADPGKVITSTCRVTTCALNASDVAMVIQSARDSTSSDVTRSQSLILLEGKKAEQNAVVQRPFVVNFEKTEAGIKPIVQVLDEGIRLAVVAYVSESETGGSDAIQLGCEIVSSRVLDVKSDSIFGIQDEPVVVQVPIHQVSTTAATALLQAGQTLLVDPHVSTIKTVQTETGAPIMGKLPYFGRVFKNTSSGSVEQHMMVLLQPSIEKEDR